MKTTDYLNHSKSRSIVSKLYELWTSTQLGKQASRQSNKKSKRYDLNYLLPQYQKRKKKIDLTNAIKRYEEVQNYKFFFASDQKKTIKLTL